MPLYRNLNPTDLALSPALGGADGQSRVAGMMVHRFVLDCADIPGNAVTLFTMFDPATALLPIVFFHALLRWDLDDGQMDNAEVAVGGSVANSMVTTNPITQGTNGDVWGVELDGTEGFAFRLFQGASAHAHFIRTDGLTVGLPIKMQVDTTSAAVPGGPFRGKIIAHLFYVSLA